MKNAINKVNGIIQKAKVKVETIAFKAMRGDSHFVAIMLTIAVVCILAVILRDQILEWFNEMVTLFRGVSRDLFGTA